MIPILTTKTGDGRTIPELICPTCGGTADRIVQDRWQKNLSWYECLKGHEFNLTAKRRKQKHGKPRPA